MKTKLNPFAVFCNRIVGESIRAKSFDDLIKKRLSKRLQKKWTEIKFKDINDNTVVISREFLFSQEMSFDEILSDWYENASKEDLQEEILTI